MHDIPAAFTYCNDRVRYDNIIHASKVKDFQNKDVTIKGFCSGYNDTDIIMEKCSVVNSKQHLTSN